MTSASDIPSEQADAWLTRYDEVWQTGNAEADVDFVIKGG